MKSTYFGDCGGRDGNKDFPTTKGLGRVARSEGIRTYPLCKYWKG